MKFLAAWTLLLQAASPPAEEGRIDARLLLEKSGDFYVFVLEGTTTLPPAAVLRARVFAVEVADFHGEKREDEQPLVWEGDEEAGQAAYRNFQAEGGKFRVEVYRFVRKPYPIRYRGRVIYAPNFQNEAVVNAVGQEEFSKAADLAVGTPKEFAAELKERTREAGDDLIKLEALFNELRIEFAARCKKPDPEAWKKWKDAWFTRVEAVAERNKERYNVWIVWMERQAKMRVSGLTDMLRNMLIACSEHFGGKPEALASAQQGFDAFHGYFEEAIEVIGVDAPLDVATLAPAMAEYEKGLEEIRQWIEKGKGEWSDVRRSARRACSGSLLRITSIVETRKRAYAYVNEVSQGFARLLERVDQGADPAALRKALEEHDIALREFKTFAGLK